MTVCKCQRCGLYWTVTHNNPEELGATGHLCPACIRIAFANGFV